MSAAIDGMGGALINYWAVRHDIEEGRLVTILDDYLTSFGEFENGIYAVFQKSRHLPLKIRVFVDFLTAEFKASLG